MAAPVLSSNWKILQAKLKTDQPAKPRRSQSTNLLPSSAPNLKRKRTTVPTPYPHKRSKTMLRPPSPPSPAPLPPSITTPVPAHHKNAGLIPTTKPGRYLALDCEMVSTLLNPSRLARVSIVNYHLQLLYDTFVLPDPKDPVTDHKTRVSGVRPADLAAGYARPLREVQEDVRALLRGRVLVGHALGNDLRAMGVEHPGWMVRDTARYAGFRRFGGGGTPALRVLGEAVLGVTIQGGEHCSVVDARAAMELFKREKGGMEDEVRKRYGRLVGRVGEGVLKGKVGEVLGGGKDGLGSDDEHGSAVLDGESEDESEGESEDDQDEISTTTAAAAKPKRKKKNKSKRKHKSRTTRA